MSEDESGQNHELIVKNKEEAERKFGCPCGKWYLSYPALFTHVKQKHEGKAPGQLIKPKTDKTRGRPRLPANNNEEDNSAVNFDCVDQLQKAIMNRPSDYQEQYQYSEGSDTCQDMGSAFLRIMGGSGDEKRLLTCFMNYIRFIIERKYEANYWETQRPNDLIDICNDIVKQHDKFAGIFPMEKETLVSLLYVLFQWMYKNKWTDHKLIKRISENDQIR